MILPRLKMNVERWKFSKEYGVYVSTEGNFKDRRKRIIPIRLNRKGYCSVRTEVGYIAAHRLVMMVWEPAPNMEQLTVDHLNHNKRDNSLDNLEWVTQEENVKRAIRDQLVPSEKQIEFAADKAAEELECSLDVGSGEVILVNGVPMRMSSAIQLVSRMGTNKDATKQNVVDGIHKALKGKNHNRYAGLKFTKIKK